MSYVLDIQFRHLRVCLDERLAWSNVASHEHVENLVGLYCFIDRHLLDDASAWIHCCFPQFFGRYSVAQAAEMARNTHESLFRAKAEKILSYITAHGSITKDQTARLLYVSGNSAYLYLKRLVREGALYRIGHGKSTRYEKVS
jgi:hypothetical protein